MQFCFCPDEGALIQATQAYVGFNAPEWERG